MKTLSFLFLLAVAGFANASDDKHAPAASTGYKIEITNKGDVCKLVDEKSNLRVTAQCSLMEKDGVIEKSGHGYELSTLAKAWDENFPEQIKAIHEADKDRQAGVAKIEVLFHENSTLFVMKKGETEHLSGRFPVKLCNGKTGNHVFNMSATFKRQNANEVEMSVNVSVALAKEISKSPCNIAFDEEDYVRKINLQRGIPYQMTEGLTFTLKP